MQKPCELLWRLPFSQLRCQSNWETPRSGLARQKFAKYGKPKSNYVSLDEGFANIGNRKMRPGKACESSIVKKKLTGQSTEPDVVSAKPAKKIGKFCGTIATRC
jgi:hypothetical protein